MPSSIPTFVMRLRGRTGRRTLAWVVPAAVVAAVGAGSTVVSSSSADVPSLPTRTAAQLLAAVQTHAASTQLSGQVREIANLGVPSMPGPPARASLSWQTFLTGSHSARVWIDGVGKQRVALIGELSEADVTHDGRDVWTYTSATNTVTHAVLPARSAQHDQLPAGATPASVAAQVLKAVDPTTTVAVDTAQRVAGRAAYTLVVRPRDTRSTVREVRIAIDAARYVPLQLQVFGAGSDPAFQIGFVDVSFTKPAASTFDFRAPQGATVSTDPLRSRSDRHHRRVTYHGRYEPMNTSRIGTVPKVSRVAGPRVHGTGWTAVVELSDAQLGSTGGMLDNLTTPVGSSGMRLLHTALVNAVFLPDGRVFVGAVNPALLERVARS